MSREDKRYVWKERKGEHTGLIADGSGYFKPIKVKVLTIK